MSANDTALTLELKPERRLIHPTQSFRYVDFHLTVAQLSAATSNRMPVTLALVLDRSGSMQGEKIKTAKRAALAALDRLEERDQVALVIFDDQIEVLQSIGSATPALKARARAALAGVEARANTALHEGWLTGCQAIAPERTPGKERGVVRCFLLTDGLANQGVTDPEQIAGEAAGIREHAGISTSTFGIGDDYNESLLGPMAVAGGGQFHHLRSADEILSTFAGELGELLAVAARQVKLEIEGEAGMSAEVVSAYWTSTPQPGATYWSVAVGDLLSGEERHIVARFGFPAQAGQETRTLRARLVWAAEAGERATDWQELHFTYAAPQACEAEPRDPQVMRWAGTHRSSRAQREALVLNQRGDLAGANRVLQEAAAEITGYAGSDQALQAEITEITGLNQRASRAPLPSQYRKEQTYLKQTESRGQRDYRRKPDEK